MIDTGRKGRDILLQRNLLVFSYINQSSPFLSFIKVKDLVVTTYECWQAAIKFCKPGEKYSDIGGIIEDIVSKKGYTSVKEFCGHG